MHDYLTVCEKAVRAGGATIQEWRGRFAAKLKGPADLVTEADVASQEVVRGIVLAAFPGHSLLGEEDAPDRSPFERTEYRWLLDPLDGTTNYVHGVPHYCISLALERDGDLLVGAIYDPIREECFTAARGEGAFLNGRRLQTSNVTRFGDALAVAGFPHNVARDSPDLLLFLEAAVRCQSVGRTGSSALNLAYLSAGRVDAYWSYSTKVWDVAAGVLLVREAGGIVTALDGGRFTLDDPHFLAASNDRLHEQFQTLITDLAIYPTSGGSTGR